MRRSIAGDLRRLAEADAVSLDVEPDPFDPELAHTFVDALKDPMPLESVEAIERAAMGIFRDQLVKPDVDDAASARAFASFFHTLGFLFKYKPYGLKAASPFGYSIFDLYPGQGFSFQLHLEPKYEAFHILRAHPGSFMYLSTRPEWLSSGERAALAWSGQGQEFVSEFSHLPAAGDVARISSTEVVHSVVGCTLEEYATTSFDAVERLLDQNDRANMTLPARHPRMRDMVTQLHPDLPLRCLERSESGWTSASMTASDPIIDVPHQMVGRRISVDQGAHLRVPAPADWVNVVVPTTAAIRCLLAGQEWTVSPGELFAVPPGWAADVAADGPTVIALHSIAPDLVLREWAR